MIRVVRMVSARVIFLLETLISPHSHLAAAELAVGAANHGCKIPLRVRPQQEDFHHLRHLPGRWGGWDG